MKKWLSVVLALSMLFSLCASTVWATEGSGGSSAPAPEDVVYGSYKNGTWSEDANGTGTVTTDDGLTLSKTAKKIGDNKDNKYEITLKVVSSSQTTTAAADAATVLVIDRSNSMGETLKKCSIQEHTHKWDRNDKKSCYKECTRKNNPSHWERKEGPLGIEYWGHKADTDCKYISFGLSGSHYRLTCTKQEHTHSSACQPTRLDAAKAAAKTFIDSYKVVSSGTNSTKRYVSIVGFGTNANTFSGWYDVSTSEGYSNALKAINSLTANGGTNLDAGLRRANERLTNNTVKDISAKNVVALTDGRPTYYGDGPSGHGDEGCPKTNAATSASATALKNAGATVYTVCFGAENELTYKQKDSKNDPHDGKAPTVGNFLSGSIATAANKAFNANTADELNKAFSDISTSVTSGLGDGKGWLVTDPMPDYITVISKPNEFVQTGDSYTWTLPQVTGVTNEETGVTTYTYEIKYTVEINNPAGLDATEYHPTNEKTTLHYGTSNSKTADFPIPGVKVVKIYTVTYDQGEHGALYEVNSDVAVSQITFTDLEHGEATPKLDEPKQVKAEDGYYFVGWNPTVADTVTGDMTYTAQYASQNEIRIIPTPVEEYYNGAKQVATKYTVVGLPDGYTLSTAPELSGEGTDAGEYPISVSNISTIQVKNGDEIDHAYTVTADTNAKLIIKKLPITLTSETAEKVYDGEELTRPDVDVKSGVTDGEKVFLREAKVEAKGAVTNVSDGRVDNSITISGISGMNYNEANYVIQKKTGTLTITPLKITLTSESAEKVYDGTPLTRPNATASITEGAAGNVTAFTDKVTGLKATGTITDAGFVANEIKYTPLDNVGFEEKNYEIIESEGTLTITPLKITLTSESAEKVYDGTPLTRPNATASITEGAAGNVTAFTDKVTDLKATGTITEVGSTLNTIVYTPNKDFVENNYTITLDPGLLTITEKEVTPGAPDVTVTKTVDKATAKRGDTLTYTITVTNNSKEDLANLTLKDVMFNDKTQKTDTTTSWTKVIDKLEAGKSQTFTYTYKVVRDDVNTKVINVVTVTDGGQLSATAQATTSVTGGGNGGNGGGTSTDTKTPVKSSSTGDMGIALYGAMALLSAGGMVWAGKKRGDER